MPKCKCRLLLCEQLASVTMDNGKCACTIGCIANMQTVATVHNCRRRRRRRRCCFCWIVHDTGGKSMYLYLYQKRRKNNNTVYRDTRSHKFEASNAIHFDHNCTEWIKWQTMRKKMRGKTLSSATRLNANAIIYVYLSSLPFLWNCLLISPFFPFPLSSSDI